MAEVACQTVGWRFATVEDREVITAMVADAAEQASLRLTPPELATSPAKFRRPDGTSVFRPKHSTVFSSDSLLAAEDHLLQRARTATGPTIDLTTVGTITSKADSEGRVLGPDQAAALASVAVPGQVVDVLVGPAGAGKTAAMNAPRRAWETEHGAGSVVGLAPSAVAAQVLADDLRIATENTAKWWTTHQHTGVTFKAGQLVIIDEASLAETLSLNRITLAAEEAGTKVLLVGDYAQLPSVDAGGAFSLLIHDRHDAPELVDVYRFTHAWEKTASLELRHGRTPVIDTYLAQDRIHDGDAEAVTAAAYTAWRHDRQQGLASVLIAETRENVTALNIHTRADLILDSTLKPGPEITLSDGSMAGVGDTIITRRNDRRLRNRHGWVHNGQTWTITAVRDDGSVTIRPPSARFGNSIVLPADYVAEHVDLGYAVTAHRAQSITPTPPTSSSNPRRRGKPVCGYDARARIEPGLRHPRPCRRPRRRRRVPCELGRQPRTLGRAVRDEFVDVGSGGNQACVAGTEQLVRTTAGDRPRHRTDLASELVGLGRYPKRPRSRAGLNDHRCC